jgi:hypothetical protein
MSYLGIVALLSLLVIIHELGYLAAAKLAGIPVASFSFGMGPKLWTWRRGETEYSLRAILLGGFVLPAVTEEEFREIPLSKRVIFFLGGPVANLLAPLPLFFILNGIRDGGGARTPLETGLETIITVSVSLALCLPVPFWAAACPSWPIWYKRYNTQRQRLQYQDPRLERLPGRDAAFQIIVFPEERRPGLSGLGAIHELPRDPRAAEPADHRP